MSSLARPGRIRELKTRERRLVRAYLEEANGSGLSPAWGRLVQESIPSG